MRICLAGANMSLEVNWRSQWITVNGMACQHSLKCVSYEQF